MKKIERVYIHSNGKGRSPQVAELLKNKLTAAGISVCHHFEQADLLVCIGGDGTFLRLLRQCRFPQVPFVGINTGHLGFFQEFDPDSLDAFTDCIKSGNYSIQKHRLLMATVIGKDGRKTEFKAINDIAIKGSGSKIIHLEMSIGASFIEHFSGDGLLFASAAGSTAYNYSLGGGIADPRVEIIQVTPIAPMNTKVFRSFTSPLLLPADGKVEIHPDPAFSRGTMILADGAVTEFSGFSSIKVEYSGSYASLMRASGYDFWSKVQSKFL